MNSSSADIEQKKEKSVWARNYFLSILIHLILFALLVYVLNLSSNSSRINSVMFSLDTREYFTEQSIYKEQNFEKQIPEANTSDETAKESIQETQTVSFSDIVADTTNLEQVYSESSLDLSISYPKGWTFIDQNKKNRLDGVTFWASDGDIYPPPYIHLEVVDKDLFIEKRYKYKLEMDYFTAFYNDAEEMQGHFTQLFYLRTDKDVDFRLKLIIKGKTEFEAFLPRFWGILKSFKFETLLF